MIIISRSIDYYDKAASSLRDGLIYRRDFFDKKSAERLEIYDPHLPSIKRLMFLSNTVGHNVIFHWLSFCGRLYLCYQKAIGPTGVSISKIVMPEMLDEVLRKIKNKHKTYEYKVRDFIDAGYSSLVELEVAVQNPVFIFGVFQHQQYKPVFNINTSRLSIPSLKQLGFDKLHDANYVAGSISGYLMGFQEYIVPCAEYIKHRDQRICGTCSWLTDGDCNHQSIANIVRSRHGTEGSWNSISSRIHGDRGISGCSDHDSHRSIDELDHSATIRC